MTQEEKDLLLKDLCARLPYGLKIYLEDFPKATLAGVVDGDIILHCDKYDYTYDTPWDIKYIKPYLLPLSSMTEEQKVEFEKMSELDCEYITTQIKNDSPNWTSGLNRVNWLIKNHFDVYDLIPMGLATDATGKNIY